MGSIGAAYRDSGGGMKRPLTRPLGPPSGGWGVTLLVAAAWALVAGRWATLGAEPLTNTPEQFAEFLKKDLVKWTKVVRESGAKVD